MCWQILAYLRSLSACKAEYEEILHCLLSFFVYLSLNVVCSRAHEHDKCSSCVVLVRFIVMNCKLGPALHGKCSFRIIVLVRYIAEHWPPCIHPFLVLVPVPDSKSWLSK